MSQKVKDFVLLIKHDRKWQILIGGLVLLILWSLFTDSQPRRYARNNNVQKVGTGATLADQSNDELLEFYKNQNRTLSERIQKQEQESKVMREKVAKDQDTTAEIFRKLIERTQALEEQVGGIDKYQNAPIYETAATEQIEVFGDMNDEDAVAPPAQPENNKVAFIAAGDSVGVELIAGANAPTDGSPYPVIFKLTTDVYGPDGSALPLGEGRIVAAAQGSLVDHRALFRLKTLNMRFPDGSKSVVDVDGWIVGEDGVRGMEGVLIDPIGRILAGELVSGTVQGFGSYFGSRGTSYQYGNGIITQQNAGNSLEQGFGQGVSRAAGNWSQYIEKRADLLVPHVKILSGRQATAVFSQNVRIDGLLESMEEPNLVFASLD